MTLLMALLASLSPTLPGALLLIAAEGWPRSDGAWARICGGGFILGSVVLGALLALYAGSTQQVFWYVAPPLLVLSTIAAVFLWRRGKLAAGGSTVAQVPAARVTPLAWLLVGLLVVQFALLAVQAWWLPTLPWDAWTTWMARAKGWYHADMFLPIVPFERWWLGEPGTMLFGHAAVYPGSLPRLAVWTSSATGGWHEGAAHLSWALLWPALGALMYGVLRSGGLQVLHALLATTMVLSLPLVSAHVALSGYADLWLAALLLLGVSYAHAGLRSGSRGELLFAGGILLLLPMVKLEGAVWLCCALLAVALVWLPKRVRLAVLIGLPLIWLLAQPFGGLPLPLPVLGTVRLGWGEVETAATGILDLRWRPVAGQVANTLFALPNWHLLWYLMPPLWIWCWRGFRAQPLLAMPGMFLVFGYLFLFVLFFFTDASKWAENLTSINRVLLHIVPTSVMFTALLWQARQPAVAGTANAPPAPTH